MARNSMTLHDVKSVEIDETYKLDNWDTTRVRHLKITDEDGNYIEITLIAEDEKFLKIKNI